MSFQVISRSANRHTLPKLDLQTMCWLVSYNLNLFNFFALWDWRTFSLNEQLNHKELKSNLAKDNWIMYLSNKPIIFHLLVILWYHTNTGKDRQMDRHTHTNIHNKYIKRDKWTERDKHGQTIERNIWAKHLTVDFRAHLRGCQI